MKPIFTIKNLTYRDILYIPELEVPQGKVTCIVGESGKGKTTFLKLLNHMFSCNEGEIYFKDQNIKDMDPVELRRKAVMLPQSPVIFTGTIKENFQIALEFSEKEKKPESEYVFYLNLVSLNKNLSDNAEEMSGGEKQRLSLARILLLEPEVLLLDEPTSSLDEKSERKVMGDVIEHAREKETTVIMVSHSKEIANLYGENIIKL